MTAASRAQTALAHAREGHDVLADALAPLVELIAERAAALVLEQLELRPASPYLNVEEAAEYLRCKPQRIYDLLSAGRLTRYKDGSRVLVPRAELDDYVASALPPASLRPIRSGVAA